MRHIALQKITPRNCYSDILFSIFARQARDVLLPTLLRCYAKLQMGEYFDFKLCRYSYLPIYLFGMQSPPIRKLRARCIFEVARMTQRRLTPICQ